MLPFAPDRAPDLSGTAVSIASARDDAFAPVASAEGLIALLREAQATVRVDWRDGGHALHRHDVFDPAAWLGDTFAGHKE